MNARIFTFKSTPRDYIPDFKDTNELFSRDVKQQRKINPDYYDIKCKLSLDFIKFSLFTTDYSLKDLFTELKKRKVKFNGSGFQPKQEWDYDYSETYSFEYEGEVHNFNVLKSTFKPFLPKIITFQNPSKELLIFLEKYLSKLAYYHVKEIEFTFDFVHEDKEYIRNFIKTHFTIKWRGKKFDHPSDTIYFNNIRFCKGKGGVLYDKPIENEKHEIEDVTRLEVRMKRPILYKNGISKIQNVIDMKAEVVTKYFEFKEFNYRLCRKRLIENDKNNNEIINEFKIIEERIADGYLYDINSLLMNQYKKYNSDTLLIKHPFHKHLLNQIRYKSFLDRDSVMVTTSMMPDKIFNSETMELLK